MMTDFVEFKRFFVLSFDQDSEVFTFHRIFYTVNIVIDSEPRIFLVKSYDIRRKLLETQNTSICFPGNLEGTIRYLF